MPPTFEFALTIDPPPFDPTRARQLLAEAGFPNGFDAGDLTPLPPYTSLGETVGGYLQAIGIRSRVRTMERATFLSAWREKKLKGLLIGATGAAGNASTRLEAYATSRGTGAYGSISDVEALFARQLQEMDRKKREEMLHQIQRILSERAIFAPIWENAGISGVGPRVEESALRLIPAFPYAAPGEELRLKR